MWNECENRSDEILKLSKHEKSKTFDLTPVKINESLTIALKEVSFAGLTSKSSDTLLRRLAEYGDVLTDAAKDMAPHAVAFYLRDLAGDFHTFYNADRVLVDDQSLKEARLALLLATRQVLQNGLKILGVSAPTKM